MFIPPPSMPKIPVARQLKILIRDLISRWSSDTFHFSKCWSKLARILEVLHSLKPIVHTCQEATTPKGNDHLPSIHFQVRSVTFVGGKFSGWVKWGPVLSPKNPLWNLESLFRFLRCLD